MFESGGSESVEYGDFDFAAWEQEHFEAEIEQAADRLQELAPNATFELRGDQKHPIHSISIVRYSGTSTSDRLPLGIDPQSQSVRRRITGGHRTQLGAMWEAIIVLTREKDQNLGADDAKSTVADITQKGDEILNQIDQLIANSTYKKDKELDLKFFSWLVLQLRGNHREILDEIKIMNAILARMNENIRTDE